MTSYLKYLASLIFFTNHKDIGSYYFYTIFLMLSFVLFFIWSFPLILNKTLSPEKKNVLTNFEDTIKISFIEAYHETLEKYKIKIFYFISQKILILIKYLIFSNKFFLIVWLPWLIFVNFFLLETVASEKFIYSHYLLISFFIFYRAIVLALYFAKNTQAYFYIKILRLDLKFFMGLDFLLNFSILKNIVLNEKINKLEDKIKAWKDFNLFLYFFVDGTILSNYFYIDLTEVRKHLDTLNFSLVFSISVFLFSKNYFSNLILCWFIFLSVYSLLVYFFTKRLISRAVAPKSLALKYILDNLIDFLGHFKWILIKEHQFSYYDTDEKLKNPIRLILPTSSRDFIRNLLFFMFYLFGSIFFLLSFLIFG